METNENDIGKIIDKLKHTIGESDTIHYIVYYTFLHSFTDFVIHELLEKQKQKQNDNVIEIPFVKMMDMMFVDIQFIDKHFKSVVENDKTYEIVDKFLKRFFNIVEDIYLKETPKAIAYLSINVIVIDTKLDDSKTKSAMDKFLHSEIASKYLHKYMGVTLYKSDKQLKNLPGLMIYNDLSKYGKFTNGKEAIKYDKVLAHYIKEDSVSDMDIIETNKESSLELIKNTRGVVSFNKDGSEKLILYELPSISPTSDTFIIRKSIAYKLDLNITGETKYIVNYLKRSLKSSKYIYFTESIFYRGAYYALSELTDKVMTILTNGDKKLTKEYEYYIATKFIEHKKRIYIPERESFDSNINILPLNLEILKNYKRDINILMNKEKISFTEIEIFNRVFYPSIELEDDEYLYVDRSGWYFSIVKLNDSDEKIKNGQFYFLKNYNITNDHFVNKENISNKMFIGDLMFEFTTSQRDPIVSTKYFNTRYDILLKKEDHYLVYKRIVLIEEAKYSCLYAIKILNTISFDDLIEKEKKKEEKEDMEDDEVDEVSGDERALLFNQENIINYLKKKELKNQKYTSGTQKFEFIMYVIVTVLERLLFLNSKEMPSEDRFYLKKISEIARFFRDTTSYLDDDKINRLDEAYWIARGLCFIFSEKVIDLDIDFHLFHIKSISIYARGLISSEYISQMKILAIDILNITIKNADNMIRSLVYRFIEKPNKSMFSIYTK